MTARKIFSKTAFKQERHSDAKNDISGMGLSLILRRNILQQETKIEGTATYISGYVGAYIGMYVAKSVKLHRNYIITTTYFAMATYIHGKPIKSVTR